MRTPGQEDQQPTPAKPPWKGVGWKLGEKNPGNQLENGWKMGKLADEFSIISFSEVDRMDLLAISEL